MRHEYNLLPFQASGATAGTTTLLSNGGKQAIVVLSFFLDIQVAGLGVDVVTLQGSGGGDVFSTALDRAKRIPVFYGSPPFGFQLPAGENLELVMPAGQATEPKVSITGIAVSHLSQA